MSVSLANTARLNNDQPFKDRVEAAVIEEAITVAAETGGTFSERTPRISLAASVLVDATNRSRMFVRLAANDNVISDYSDPSLVPDDELRRVVASMWSNVAAAVV